MREPCCYASAGNHPCTCKEDNEPIIEKETMNTETMREQALRVSQSGQGAIVSELKRLMIENETLKARVERLNEIIEEMDD